MVQRLTALLPLAALLTTNTLAVSTASRELVRHNSGNAPEELNVNAKDTFNSEFMKDMHSACRPEKDGYFGSTYGEPVRLSYGFRIETKPLSSIVDMIDLVEDRIVDQILSNSFPNLCSFGGRRLSEGGASGFRFLKLVGKQECTATAGAFDFCGIFAGQVNIFGANNAQASASVYEMIRNALTVDHISEIHDDIVSIKVDEGRFGLTGDLDLDDDSDANANLIGYICFGIAGVIFAGIFYWKCWYKRKEMDTAAGNRSRGLFGGNGAGYDDYDPSARNIMPNYEDGSEYGKLNFGSYARPIAVGFSDTGSAYSGFDDYDMKDHHPDPL